MLRAFYLSAILFSVVLAIVSLYYMNEVHDARMESLYDMMNDYSYDNSYNSYSGYSDTSYDDKLTVEAGLISLFFFLFFAALGVLTLIKLKTKTMKVLTIISFVFTGLMLAWDSLMMSSPGGISFDEVGVVWVLFAVMQLAFCIIGTIHAFKRGV